jgi:hypothetical protein
VRQHELSFIHVTGVEVHDRSASRAYPLGDALACIFSMFDEYVIADTKEMIPVGCCCLIGFDHAPATDLDCPSGQSIEFARWCDRDGAQPIAVGRCACERGRRQTSDGRDCRKAGENLASGDHAGDQNLRVNCSIHDRPASSD